MTEHIQIDRFEIVEQDRTDKTNIAILDHKYDKKIVHVKVNNEDNSKKLAEEFKSKIEELINNGEISW